jgi:hypothetical protein
MNRVVLIILGSDNFYGLIMFIVNNCRGEIVIFTHAVDDNSNFE